MNDQQLEKAARALCQIRGLDPDEKVKVQTSTRSASYSIREQWRELVYEIKRHAQVEAAIYQATKG